MIVVGGYHETASAEFDSDVAVHTALVESETAAALARALQTVKEPYDYRIPEDGDDLEIDDSPYRLLGWISHWTRDSGIDEKDPFRRSIGGIRLRPGKRAGRPVPSTLTALGNFEWRATDGELRFLYEAWSDTANDQDQRRTGDVDSNGYRLWVSVPRLSGILRKRQLDLVVEVMITRRRGTSRHGQKDKDETIRSAKIFILRADGAIEDSGGRVGTWNVPSQRTGA